MIKDLGDEKNRRNESIILTRPRKRKGINRLCTRAPKPAIKTGQLSILMIRKPVHRVRTPFLFGQKEIVPLDPPMIIIHNSTQKISSVITIHLRRPWTSAFFRLSSGTVSFSPRLKNSGHVITFLRRCGLQNTDHVMPFWLWTTCLIFPPLS